MRFGEIVECVFGNGGVAHGFDCSHRSLKRGRSAVAGLRANLPDRPSSFYEGTFMNVKNLLRRIAYRSLVPQELRVNQRPLSQLNRERLQDALRQHYFSQPMNHFGRTVDQYLATQEGIADMDNHVEERLNYDREWVMPWLNAARALKGSTVLEIGCGTGASTISLSEQGAHVTAVDVNEGNIQAAQKRCQLYDLPAQFAIANATELHKAYNSGAFDFIIFFATLEH